MKQLSIDGWLDLKWGESKELARAKLKELLPNSVRCQRVNVAVKKGVKQEMIACRDWKHQPDGRSSVAAVFLDDKLGRVSVIYHFRPFEAALLNLEKTLTERYCPLEKSLSDVVQQARLGNIGQELQATFECTDELFLSIKNGKDTSQVAVTLSSQKYTAFLEESEHEGSF